MTAKTANQTETALTMAWEVEFWCNMTTEERAMFAHIARWIDRERETRTHALTRLAKVLTMAATLDKRVAH